MNEYAAIETVTTKASKNKAERNPRNKYVLYGSKLNMILRKFNVVEIKVQDVFHCVYFLSNMYKAVEQHKHKTREVGYWGYRVRIGSPQY